MATVYRTIGDRLPFLYFTIKNQDGSAADLSTLGISSVWLHFVNKAKTTVIVDTDGVGVIDTAATGQCHWEFGTGITAKKGVYYFKVKMKNGSDKELSTSGYTELIIEE